MKKTILIISVVLQFNATQAWQEFHGGDVTLVQATMIANRLLSDIEKIPTLEHLTPYLLEGFFKAEIVSTSHDLILNGQKKVALVTKFNADMNGPIKLEINSELWSKLTEDEKNLLMMHELLNLTTFTDDDYFYSNIYISKIMLLRRVTEQNKTSLTQFILSGFEKCSFENMKTAYPIILLDSYLRKIQEKLNESPEKYCIDVHAKFKQRFDSILN